MDKQPALKTLVDTNRLRRLIICGHSNAEIAALLHCSEKTVSRRRTELAGEGVQIDTDWHATVRILRSTGLVHETIIYMRIRGASLGRIADLFCMDRQQVFNITKNITGGRTMETNRHYL